MNNIHKIKYFVSGMHCSSCELLIEKRILEEKGVKLVNVSLSNKSVVIDYVGEAPKVDRLNKIFKGNGYTFSSKPFDKVISNENVSCSTVQNSLNDWIIAGSIVISVFCLFYILNKLGITSLVNVTKNSSFIIFFLFGLVAGTSTCAALVGGIVLSLSKEWNKTSDLSSSKVIPHLYFNLGRIISFSIFGAILGAFGSVISLSISFGAILTIAVSLLMLIISLQMLGVPYFKNLQIGLPKFLTRYAIGNGGVKLMFMPVITGLLTVILPCGFTITVQSLALSSGSWINGLLMMLAFVLGTTPILLLIGLSSGKLFSSTHFSRVFTIVAGILIISFAFYNINAQLTVLGVPNFRTIISSFDKENSNADVSDGVQVIKMEASGRGYSPNSFTVKKNVPVRWEVTNKGVTGCTNAIIAKDFFDGNFKIDKDLVVKEFTPTKTGTFYFTCWMGMAYGTITVVE